MTSDRDVPADLASPLPLVIASDAEVAEAVFGGREPGLDTPMGSAFLWWKALLDRANYLTALRKLSYNPRDWGDYVEAASLLDGWALMSKLIDRPDPDPDIAAVKFMRDTGHAMMVFADAKLDEVMVLTLVRVEGQWLVWGLTGNGIPSNRRIRQGIPD